MINEGYIRKAQYDEFLLDEADKELYNRYFESMHEDLRKYLETSGSPKKIDKLILPKGISIFDYRKAGLSLGDVHMVLMALFTRIPVILSDDSDMEILKVIVKKKISYSGFELSILGCVEVLEKIALMENSVFSKNELIDILKNAGEAKNKSVIKQAWNKGHVS